MNAPDRNDQAALVLDRLGRPLRDLRMSVIETCNFRCPYCMPEETHPDEPLLGSDRRLDFQQIEVAVRGFVALGVSKVRLTGGEPLLRKDLPQLVRRLAAIEGVEDLALTTNGSLLARQAQALRDAGLRRLTVSLDTLDPQRFREMTGGRGDLADVLAGIEAAERAGFTSIKINTVVLRGMNDGDVLDLAAHFRDSGHVLRFIEYMDVGTCNGWRREGVLPSAQVRDAIAARWPLRALDANYRGEVARRHAYVNGQGEIGFISSVSAPFCGDCHRARLSADGKLYTCLFAGEGHDLRPWLDDPVALAGHLRDLWSARADRYSELRGAARGGRHIEMYVIGG
ncbi:MAG: GTP 3',8-cyclase MoaA [Proteobacteria bacterium]|nr:GTP 3',8-cyclase MoaA [Pseudomonadota bacterium]